MTDALKQLFITGSQAAGDQLRSDGFTGDLLAWVDCLHAGPVPGGLSLEETAQLLGVTARTVRRDWIVARAWLRKEVAGEGDKKRHG